MNKLFYLAAFLIIFAAGCKNNDFKKSKNSLEYKIISGNGDKALKYGDAMKFTAVGYYRDSILSTPYDSEAQVQPIDSATIPPEYIQIFVGAKKGDSIITRMSVDTLIKKGQQLPPYAKKGQFLGFRIKIIDVITDKIQADAMRDASMKQAMKIDTAVKQKQLAADDKALSDIIARDKVNAIKTNKGIYVEVKEPGTGMPVDSGKVVTMNYKGMTLNGNVFDKSYDESGKSVKPLSFGIGTHTVIEGMDEGMRLFKKGGKGRLFIPSGLAYGNRGAGGAISPNQPLIFEVEVVDVQTMDAFKKQREAENKAMQQLQKNNPNAQPQMQPQAQPQGQQK